MCRSNKRAAHLRDTLVAWQLFLEPKLDQSQAGTAFIPGDISLGGRLSLAHGDLAKRLSATLRSRGLPQADELDAAMKRLATSTTNLAPAVTGASLTPTKRAAIVAAERSAFAAVWDVTSPLSREITNHTVSDAQDAADQSGLAQATLMLSSVLILLLTLAATFVLTRRAVDRQRRAGVDERRQVFGTELQEALGFTETETAVYGIVGQALTGAVPALQVELLIADSSRAHFRRVLSSHDDLERADGCGVVAPAIAPRPRAPTR